MTSKKYADDNPAEKDSETVKLMEKMRADSGRADGKFS